MQRAWAKLLPWRRELGVALTAGIGAAALQIAGYWKTVREHPRPPG